MVLESIEFNNTQMQTVDVEMYPQEFVTKSIDQVRQTEREQELLMFEKILQMLPPGYNIPQNADQYDIIMHAIQYINALQALQHQVTGHWSFPVSEDRKNTSE